MKLFKFLISSICILLNFSSCITDKKEIPVKTLKPYWIHFEVNATLYEYIDMYLTCLNIDKWVNAPNVSDRYSIEDKYFYKEKIREFGDTIQLVDRYYVVIENKEVDSKSWKILFNKDYDDLYFRIKETNGDVQVIYDDIVNDELTFSFKLTYEEKLVNNNLYSYNPSKSDIKRYKVLSKIEGNGYLKNPFLNNSVYQINITEPLEFYYFEGDVFQCFDFVSGQMEIVDGYKSDKSPYTTKITYLSSYEMEILYRGFTETWHHSFSYGFPIEDM